MALSKIQKRFSIIFGIIILVIALAIIIINLLLGRILEGQIESALAKGQNPIYKVQVDGASINIISGNIRLKGISLVPDSSYVEKVKNGEGHSANVFRLEIPILRFVGIGLYDAIVHQDIHLRKIELKNAHVFLLQGKAPKIQETEKVDKESKKFNPDSIFIKGLGGLSLHKIVFTDYNLDLIDLEKDEVLLKQRKLGFEITGIKMDKLSDTTDLFDLNVEDALIEFPKQKINLPGGNYQIRLSNLKIIPSESLIVLKGFSLKPTYTDKFKLAKKFPFTTEIFDLSVEELRVINIDFRKLVTGDGVFIDTVLISNLNLNILMDKRLPFNEDKRPKLPNELLKSLKFPLYVKDVIIQNSKLVYQEKMPDHVELMTAILADWNVNVNWVTSIPDSIKTRKSMTINLTANFMEKPPMRVDFNFPMYSTSDTFYFSGHLASAKLSTFNKAAFPAIGAKFISGTLTSISFTGSANPSFSKGEMTFLYKDLEAEMIKKDQVSKNKFFSWAANTALRKGNPGKNGKERVVPMHFERVPYKGFGNVVWKTLQSGVVSTISPVGKTVKEDKPAKNEKKNPEEQSQQMSEDDNMKKSKQKKEKRKKEKNKKKDK